MRVCFIALGLVGAAAVALGTATCALAQSLYFTSDRTVANGDPINGNYTLVFVGIDSNFTAYPGVHADITSGTDSSVVQARSGSTVDLSAVTSMRLPPMIAARSTCAPGLSASRTPPHPTMAWSASAPVF